MEDLYDTWTQCRIKERQEHWNGLSRRIGAIRCDLAMELGSERKVVLQGQLKDLEKERCELEQEIWLLKGGTLQQAPGNGQRRVLIEQALAITLEIAGICSQLEVRQRLVGVANVPTLVELHDNLVKRLPRLLGILIQIGDRKLFEGAKEYAASTQGDWAERARQFKCLHYTLSFYALDHM